MERVAELAEGLAPELTSDDDRVDEGRAVVTLDPTLQRVSRMDGAIAGEFAGGETSRRADFGGKRGAPPGAFSQSTVGRMRAIRDQTQPVQPVVANSADSSHGTRVRNL